MRTIALFHKRRFYQGAWGKAEALKPIWDALYAARVEFVVNGQDKIVAVRDNSTWGVIKFTPDSARYSWKFVPAAGGTFTDSGTGNCHQCGFIHQGARP